MSDDRKSAGGSLPSTGLVWLVIFAAGAFIAHEVPWQGSRPSGTEPKAYPYIAKQDIDSRLWQDPLGAVVRGRDDIRKQYAKQPDAPVATVPATKAPGDTSTVGPNTALQADAPSADRVEPPPATEASAHAPDLLRLRIARDRKVGRALVLGVMIPGGSYPESVEYRRRMRYAALAGLDRMGFAPDDPEHLGYVMPRTARLPEFIAYEWLSPKVGPAPSVLVLWLDEDIFGSDTIKRVDALVAMVTRTGPGEAPPPPIDCEADDLSAVATDFFIVGPSYTSTLQDMLRTVRSVPCAKGRRLPVFYPYGATADDAELLKSVGFPEAARSVHAAFRQGHLQVLRTIGTDSKLLAAVKRELKLRGVDPAAAAACDRSDGKPRKRQHVVLISERDTFYGRTLPEMMEANFNGDGCPAATGLPYVHRFSYLRGLDGQVSSIGADAASKAAASKSDPTPADRTASAKQIERPEGQGQFDYLRRLSLQLAALDHDLRRSGDGTIMAVGVLGSDVYDKLLVLQALRSQFQNVLFFTTDLDARMLHPQEQDWARNLIVASNFGLQLNPALQADILPFRDGYQTSVFLSTQIALTNALRCGADRCIDQSVIDGWLAAPRMFEIGRSTAFDYSDPSSPQCDPRSGLVACVGVHPGGSARYTEITGTVFRDGMLLLFLAAVLLALAKGFGAAFAGWIAVRRIVPIAVCAAGSVVVVAFAFFGAPAWSWVADRLTEHNDGEPISLVQGISIWPTEAIRLIAVAASVGFLFWAWRLLDGNLRAIAKQMRFEPEHQVMVDQVRAEYAKWTWWRRLIRSFSFRLTEYSGGPAVTSIGLSWTAQVFWKKYLYQGRFASRALRVTSAVVIYFVVAIAVIGYFGAPNTPYRGAFALHWNNVIVLTAVWMMLFVIFFVVDATVFCHQLVHALQQDIANEEPDLPTVESAWAASTLAHYAARFGIHGRHLDAWILMDFITLRTRVVAKLIYFPFIVISLMVLSRSQFFDNWTMPIGLVIVLGSSVLIVSGCAVLLRESAEDARRKVLALLNDDLIRLKGDEGRTGQQIEAMIGQVKALHEGAFAPYSQQPLFRALLLPLSTFGGSALLDYLTQSSF